MIYRFTFDPNGTAQVVDDPINWNDSELNIERDDNIKGIFYQYTADLEWVGSAYSYIETLDNSSDCWEFDVLIEFKVNPDDAFQTLFNGRIYSYDVEFDLQKQIAKCKIVDQNLTQIILDRQEIQVNTGVAQSIGNVNIGALTPTDVQVSAIEGSDSTTADIPMYRVNDVLEHIVKSISDNQVAFDSDWFSTGGLSDQAYWQLTIGSIPTSNTFTITIVTEIGTFTGSQTNTGSTGGTDGTFALAMNDIIDGDQVSEVQNDFAAPFRILRLAAGVFEIYSLFDIKSISTSGSTVSTPIKRQDATPSMTGLHITNGVMTRFNFNGTVVNDTLKISLTQALSELNRIFDMTFKIFDDGGQPTMKLERTAEFFDQASAASVVITGVRNLFVKRNNDFKLNSINHEDGGKDFKSRTLNEVNAHQPLGFATTEQCGQDSFNASNNWVASNQVIQRLFNDDSTYDDRIILFETILTTDTAVQYQVTGVDLSFNIDTTYRLFNGFLSRWWRQKYWMVSTGKQVTSGDVTLENTDIILDKEYEFTAPISQVDVNAIVADPSVKINVSGEGLTATDMWILSMSVDIKTGLVQFKTISNE